ncbi:nitroreductase/quinone reductase family protein [Actinoplanes derwentensis]|uniref:Deazaflavin-dependent oxidoreductase, nitroreductase family n=1 Tax=Actinoplanes derwentensis TaxID=113562 RepID=A0A1H1WQ41_9ACTN|nr:nitroreductase/quinone reductase family protein [Actinoplanes derwentensis]GID87019.1 cation-binding protein [Actinoplanes derwentensis]SDS99194.1 deazaflavin-dependent oxidoreductase, nitroreductase family [Actinoplanes derwentensis]
MTNDFNTAIIDEFRAHHGRVGGMFEGARLLLLTTTGARSGRPHTVPLGYLPDGDRILVIASAGGSPRHPAWYHNILAEPVVTVEDGVFVYQATAAPLAATDRDEAFARAVEQDPGWDGYQRRSGRTIPVVALVPIPVPGPPRSNASTPGEMLRIVHDAFRRELALIRAEIATSGTILSAQLRVNCLTLCVNLDGHHTREDDGMFPALEQFQPDLAPALTRLRAEHEIIAELLKHLRTALSDPTLTGADLIKAVDVLTADLERHLDYEEQVLIPILDGA